MAESMMNPDSLSDSSSVDVNMDGMQTPELTGAEGAEWASAEKVALVEGPVGGEKDVGATGGDGQTVEGGIDRLLQQHRREIMYELRRLQHGDRPVTGQENRKNVEDFFLRSSNPEPTPEARPENVVVEVRGLVERRPVSSLLQSFSFRRALENTLRGGFARPNGQPVAPQLAARLPAPQAQNTAPEVRVRAQQIQAQLSEIHERRARQSPEAPTAVPVAAMAPSAGTAPSPPPPAPLPPVEPRERAEAWLRQQPQVPPQGEQPSLWDDMEQGQRESLINDISELVQAQLVTNTLHGDFRETLEVHMNNRLRSSGLDGSRVQQVINGLPRIPPHMRNNFSDLGIAGPPGNHDNLSDNVSVISATAAVTIPNSQSTAVLTREMGSLKAQMEELKNMMKLSFDLQLDIQRAIRQEVAAAVSGALASQSAAAVGSTPRPGPSRPADSGKCIICLDAGADAVLYKCGHQCLCYTCGLNLRQRSSTCPVCRAPIHDIIRAYTVGNNQ